jgi:hypothetical protein
LAVAALLVLTESCYLRPSLLTGRGVLAGMDYYELHIRRMRFAREALFGGQHTLPAWYPREVLGTPFAANLQSFPWIPTRLVLLAFDPSVAYAAGVAMAAALAALFTFLYCRRAGLGRVGAVAAGFTFACAGFFAARVMAGHLPLLEAYPALPLLLWLVERGEQRRNLIGLGIASACLVAAGHPQVPAYAMAAALLFAVLTRRFRAAGAMVLGAGLTLVVWWPMLLLIGRSTRVLSLAAPENDIAMPYGRLLALIVPGIDGWAYPVTLADRHEFSGYPNYAYFWDTAAYIGILPLVAIAGLGIRCAMERRMPEFRWTFLALLSLAAFLCALPFASPLLHALPGTILRSPARLLYIPTFGAAVAVGIFSDWLRRVRWAKQLVLLLLAVHFADLGWFSSLFIHVDERDESPAAFQATIDRETGDARIAEERTSDLNSNDERHDDAGGFDSIFLANSYRSVIHLAGFPPETNRQIIDATQFPESALEQMGVKFVITSEPRSDLEYVATNDDDVSLYRVPHPFPRASFSGASFSGTIGYRRPSSDEILLHTRSGKGGIAQILESWDPGWRAAVDGAPVQVRPSNGLGMAVALPAGEHTVRLQYGTPGRAMGVVLSAISLAGLGWLVRRT